MLTGTSLDLYPWQALLKTVGALYLLVAAIALAWQLLRKPTLKRKLQGVAVVLFLFFVAPPLGLWTYLAAHHDEHIAHEQQRQQKQAAFKERKLKALTTYRFFNGQ